jgi:hypothetical protein
VQRVKEFAAFLGRSPGTANVEDVRRFRLHLAANGTGTPTSVHEVGGIFPVVNREGIVQTDIPRVFPKEAKPASPKTLWHGERGRNWTLGPIRHGVRPGMERFPDIIPRDDIALAFA